MPKSKKKSCPFPRKPLGVKRNHLASLYSNIPSDRGDLKNGHVLQLFFEHERSAPETLRVLSCLPCTQSKIKIHHIRRIVKKYEAFKQQKRENENETFMHFCSETFTCELGSLCPEPLDTSVPSMSNSSQAGPMSSPMLHVSPMDTQVQLSPEPSDCGTSKCTPVQEQPTRSDPLTAQIGTSSPQEVQVQQHALLSEPGPSKRTSSQMIDTGLTVSAGIPEEPLTSPLPAQIETPGLAVPISQAPSPSSIRESRRKAPQTPRKSKLKRRLAFSTVSRMAERKTHKEKIKTLRDNVKDQRVKIKEVKHLKQNIKRKSELLKKKDLQIKQLNKELRAPKAESNPDIADELRTSKREVKRLKRENKTIKDRLKLSCDCFIETVKLKDEIKMKNDTITLLQYENVKLEEQLDARKESYTKTFEPEGRRFPLEVRRFVYDCIINQLPTTNVPAIVRKAGERFGFSIKAPGRSAVEFMVRELGIVSDYMVAEYILGHENLTLGFDATTQEGVHINEIHITSANNCLVVDIEQLPGGTTEDYEMHIVDSFNRVAEVYAAFESNNYEEVRQNIISNLKNTMTDRVAVNHSTISRLEETWGVALNELNCHLHPLDTVASTCRAALKNGEDTKGKLYGTDCIAANLVLAINKVRFKDGKGDPKGFVAFLDQEGLPKGLLPRYRGNRLHVLFHISGKLICYYDSFLKFFSSTTVSCGGLLGLILCDFTSTAAQVELQVLGLLGKLLSGPWMRAFYTAGGAQSVSHIDGIDVVRNIISRIKTAITMPMDTLTMRKDFLEQELNADEDRVLQKLQSKPADEEMFAKMMVACMSKIVEVLERQYRRYFDLDITDKLREETESTRCHNIDAEEVMGMFSAAKEHAPNATLCFLSSKIRAQKNRASEYLDGLSLEKREQVVAFSIPRGREQRKSKRKKSHEIKEEIQCRIAAKAHKRETYQRHKLERKLKCADLDISVEFKDRDADFQEILKNILEGRIVGHRICHIWHEDAVKVVYSGKVEKLKKKSGGTYVVSYWNESDGEKYEDAIDYDISKVAFAADFIMEDLVIS